jgi:hypothetical protein
MKKYKFIKPYKVNYTIPPNFETELTKTYKVGTIWNGVLNPDGKTVEIGMTPNNTTFGMCFGCINFDVPIEYLEVTDKSTTAIPSSYRNLILLGALATVGYFAYKHFKK